MGAELEKLYSNLPNLVGILISLQIFSVAVFFVLLRRFEKRNHAVANQMSSLLNRMETLTATRREQIIKHYDKLLKKLSSRIPPMVAVHLGTTIFETESEILKRLIQLEPSIAQDTINSKKMEELVRLMANLEQSLVALTADAIRNVMQESRADLIDEEKFLKEHLAA